MLNGRGNRRDAGWDSFWGCGEYSGEAPPGFLIPLVVVVLLLATYFWGK